jgi:penicillin-binding protein 2
MKKEVDVVANLLKIRDKDSLPIFDSLVLSKRIKKAMSRRFDVTRLKEDISIDIVSIIEEHSMELPGILVQTEARREYPLGPVSFHVLGYMSEIPEAIFDSLKELGYRYGDNIGQAGIEKQYESILHGKDGHEYIELNAYGRSLGPIAHMPRIDPLPGNSTYLTIDARLQRVACEAFPDTCKGAVVAINPQNGEVLAMYSNPSVDPNIFSLAATLRSKSWAQAARDPNLPLNNRATSGTYPPGSTFKVVSALAGMGCGKINPKAFMPRSCTGAYRIGNRVAHCWNLKGHGRLKLREALKVSCNIYFYQLGLKVGDRIINYYAENLGLGQLTGIDLPNERKGWLSGEEAYNIRFKKRGWKWTKGLVLDLAIGQTQLVTPLQLALMCGGLGNGDVIYTPFLLKEERSSDGIVIRQLKEHVRYSLNLDADLKKIMHQAMEDVIVGAGGTGRRARVPGVRVGGKSGSAENPHGEKTHGLFIACAPIDNPVISVAAVVENAGHGGRVAAPIVGSILRYFFAETEEGRRLVEKYSQKDPTKG